MFFFFFNDTATTEIYTLSLHDALPIFAAVREQDPETPVILMTAQASLQSAIQAVNQGAFYYIQKPFSNDDLVAICRRAAEQRLLKAENKQLKQEIRRRERSGLVKRSEEDTSGIPSLAYLLFRLL